MVRSELQAALSGSIGQRLHATMILVTGAVKRDRGDAGAPGLLGDPPADQPGRLDIAAVLDLAAHFLLERGRRGQHARTVLVDDLRIDMVRRAVNGQTLGAEFVDPPADTAGATQTLVFV